MSQAKVANIANLAGTKTITTDDLIDRATCRAWVNFDGTSVTGDQCHIRANFNVDGVTRNGTGDYTVNFTNAMPDANYCVTGSAAKYDSSNNGNTNLQCNGYNHGALAPNTVNNTTVVLTQNTSTTKVDSGVVTVAVFR